MNGESVGLGMVLVLPFQASGEYEILLKLLWYYFCHSYQSRMQGGSVGLDIVLWIPPSSLSRSFLWPSMTLA